jgi:hypothetical protein
LSSMIWICCLPSYLQTSCKAIELPFIWLETVESN